MNVEAHNPNWTRLLVAGTGGVLIPILAFVAAVACGWAGITDGYLFDPAFFFSCLILTIIFAVMTPLVYQMAKRLVLLYFVLFALCLAGSYWGTRNRPFLRAFEARLKHELSSNIPAMQHWAIKLCQTAQKEESEGEYYSSRRAVYPPWLVSSHVPRPTILIIGAQNPDPNNCYVELQWACGRMAQWGLAIGNPGMPHMGHKWAQGVYFFSTGPE